MAEQAHDRWDDIDRCLGAHSCGSQGDQPREHDPDYGHHRQVVDRCVAPSRVVSCRSSDDAADLSDQLDDEHAEHHQQGRGHHHHRDHELDLGCGAGGVFADVLRCVPSAAAHPDGSGRTRWGPPTRLLAAASRRARSARAPPAGAQARRTPRADGVPRSSSLSVYPNLVASTPGRRSAARRSDGSSAIPDSVQMTTRSISSGNSRTTCRRPLTRPDLDPSHRAEVPRSPRAAPREGDPSGSRSRRSDQRTARLAAARPGRAQWSPPHDRGWSPAAATAATIRRLAARVHQRLGDRQQT